MTHHFIHYLPDDTIEPPPDDDATEPDINTLEVLHTLLGEKTRQIDNLIQTVEFLQLAIAQVVASKPADQRGALLRLAALAESSVQRVTGFTKP